MQPASAALDAESRKSANQPLIQLTIADHAIDVPFLKWADVYSQAIPGYTHDAVVAGDGSVNMVQLNSNFVQTRRIADPTVAASWSTTVTPWITRRTSVHVQPRIRPVICAAYNPTNDPTTPNAAGRNKRVQIYWLENDGRFLRGAHSTDYGVSWTTTYAVASPSTNHRFAEVAADMSSGSAPLNPRVFFAQKKTTSNATQMGYVYLTNTNRTYSSKRIYPTITTNVIGSLTVANGPDPDDPTNDVSYIVSVRERPENPQDVIHCLTLKGTTTAPVWAGERIAYVGDLRHYNEIRVSGPYRNATPARYVVTFNRIKDEYKDHNASIISVTPNPNIISELRPWKRFADTGMTMLRRPTENAWYLIATTWAARAGGYEPDADASIHVVTNEDALIAIDVEMRENAISTGEIVLDNSQTNYSDANHPAALRAGAQALLRTGYRVGATPIQDTTVPQSTWYIQRVRYVRDRTTGNAWVHLVIGDPAAFIDSLWQPIHHDPFYKDTLINRLIEEQRLIIPAIPQLPSLAHFLASLRASAPGPALAIPSIPQLPAINASPLASIPGINAPYSQPTRPLHVAIPGINAPYPTQLPPGPLAPIPGFNTRPPTRPSL